MKKRISTFLALMLTAAVLLAACGTPTSPPADPPTPGENTPPSNNTPGDPTPNQPDGFDLSERVELQTWWLGDPSPDMQLVIDMINEKTLEKFNTTMKLNWISWADFTDMYSLMFASGEEFDAIYTADWSFYVQEAQRNGFMELTPEMLQTYAPLTWENTPSGSWDQVKVNGQIFMVPQDHDEWAQRQIMVRGDFMEKYNIPPIRSMADLTVYFDAVAQNEPGIAPFGIMPIDAGMPTMDMVLQEKGWAHIGGYYSAVYDYNDPGGNLINLYETPELLQILRQMREWNLAGYIPRNTLSNPTLSTEMFQNGMTAVCFQNMSQADVINNAFKADNPDWSVLLIDGTFGQTVLPYPAKSGGMGISRTSKHPERVLMIIDYLRNDKEMNWLAQRGIRGSHWELAGDGSDENLVVAGPNAGNYYDCFTWGPWRNTEFQPVNADAVAGYKELNDSLATRKASHPLQFFTFNDENVRAEVAAMQGLTDQYLIPLLLGFVDPVEGLADLMTAYRHAGMDKVNAEMQRQVYEYLAEL